MIIDLQEAIAKRLKRGRWPRGRRREHAERVLLVTAVARQRVRLGLAAS